RRETRVVQRDRVLRGGDPLRPDPVDPGFRDQADALLGGRQPENPGRSRQPAGDARLRPEALAHLELVGLAEPALDRVAELRLEIAPDVEVGRRAGAAV